MTTPMPVRSFQKDPDASLDFGFDWTEWLESGDVVLSSAWTSTPSGLTLFGPDFGPTSTVTWLSGGEDGTEYLVTNRVTTRDGRTDDRTFAVSVIQR